MAQKEVYQLERALSKLRRHLARPPSKEIEKLFSHIEKALTGLKARRLRSPKAFSFVSLVQQVLKLHDILFLNRHLSYHVVAPSDLPPAAGNPEEAMTVLSELLETTARQAAFGSRLEIHLQRADGAIQIHLAYEGKAMTDLDRRRFIEEIYGTVQKEGSLSGIATAKDILRHVGGQFWLAFPSETGVTLTFNWPAEGAARKASAFATYKYDIWLTDFRKIRQSFGIPKSGRLVAQVEKAVRSLVRHPMDIVIGFPNQGMVTTIYESQEGAGSSVAGRISSRLRTESFRVGTKKIKPKFRYQLSELA